MNVNSPSMKLLPSSKPHRGAVSVSAVKSRLFYLRHQLWLKLSRVQGESSPRGRSVPRRPVSPRSVASRMARLERKLVEIVHRLMDEPSVPSAPFAAASPVLPCEKTK